MFAGVMYHDYGSRLASGPAELEGYLLAGNRQRGLGPGGVHVRSRGSGGDGGHGVFVVAGGAAPGVPGAAVGRVRRWRWPAA